MGKNKVHIRDFNIICQSRDLTYKDHKLIFTQRGGVFIKTESYFLSYWLQSMRR